MQDRAIGTNWEITEHSQGKQYPFITSKYTSAIEAIEQHTRARFPGSKFTITPENIENYYCVEILGIDVVLLSIKSQA